VPDEEHLRRRLHELAKRNKRLGYKKQHAILCREGWKVNRKRVRRIWREEGLQVPARKRRRRRGRRAPGHIAPCRPDQVWAMDFQFDDITRGRRVKILNVTDEFTRESLAGKAARHITAKDTVAVLEEITARRGVPTHIRCDIQRARVHLQGPSPLVLEQGIRDGSHRAGLTVAESLRGVLQR
jgi:putative transposase